MVSGEPAQRLFKVQGNGIASQTLNREH